MDVVGQVLEASEFWSVDMMAKAIFFDKVVLY
jgi:hypothetical protein